MPTAIIDKSKPLGITCPDYQPQPGTKRCAQYLPNGACARPDDAMCVEWVKLNGERSLKFIAEADSAPACGACEVERLVPASSPIDFFGSPNPAYRQGRASCEPAGMGETPQPPATDLFGYPLPVLDPSNGQPARGNVPAPCEHETVRVAQPLKHLSRGPLTEEDIASFRELNVEVCFNSQDLGELWLVPEYTDQRRTELTPEHVEMLRLIRDIFPGSRPVMITKAPAASEETEA